jgi:signal transduction histidine kinase
MSIRLRIGLGFTVMIITVTALLSYWGAQTLHLSLESSDFEQLHRLRQRVLRDWAVQHRDLQQLAGRIAHTFERINLEDEGPDGPAGTAARLKRHLHLDWLEVLQDGVPLLYPAIRPHPDLFGKPRVTWPVRPVEGGPLSNMGFHVAVATMSRGLHAALWIARRPELPDLPLIHVWDNQGLLAGDRRTFSRQVAREYETRPGVRQRIFQGRLFRVHVDRVAPGGPFLAVGVSADTGSLTRTGVNELMFRLGLLQIVGLSILGYFLARRLFRPLENLRGRIERVAAGHWEEIPRGQSGPGQDEIDALTASFNHMVRELSAAQARLLEVQTQLMTKEKMAVLGRFSAGVAHEINNPLGAILVSAGLLRDALIHGRPVETEDIETILDETRRCQHIVETLLRYAHNRPPVLQSLDLTPFLKAETQRWQEGRGGDGPRVTWADLSILEGRQARFDPIGVAQVLRNLLDNAADAVAEVTEPHLEIAVSAPDAREPSPDRRTTATPGKSAPVRGSREFEWVCISVIDNGIGLAQAPPNLFEPLATGKEHGTGLGLAISQSIIEGHGCRLWAEKTPDGRTRFAFTLPLNGA